MADPSRGREDGNQVAECTTGPKLFLKIIAFFFAAWSVGKLKKTLKKEYKVVPVTM